MKRRKFLTIAGIGGLLAAAVSLRFVTVSIEDAIVKRIASELGFLKLDNDGIRRFVADYTKTMSSRSKLMLKGYSLMRLDPSGSQKINNLMNAYLLSTDFFMNGMDEGKEVKYVGLYDPYNRPCAHPFSSAYYPASA